MSKNNNNYNPEATSSSSSIESLLNGGSLNEQDSNIQTQQISIQEQDNIFIYRSNQSYKRVRLSNESNHIQNEQPRTTSIINSYFEQFNLSNRIIPNYKEINSINIENSSAENNNSVQTVSHMNIQNSVIHENNEEASSRIDVNNSSSVQLMQTSIQQYFPSDNIMFQEIKNLNETTLNFRIRCKILYKSSKRVFGNNNKVFDALVCDYDGEIKIAAFNEEVDRLYDLMINNETIIIENGNVQIANEKYRSPYSLYEIRLLSTSTIHQYNNREFKPMMIIMKKTINEINQTLHGTHVDTEGIVVMDKGTTTSTDQQTGQTIRRRSLKIKDQTGLIFITFWNRKINEIPEHITNKKIRIRNGKTNHFNDYITINVSEQTSVEYY